MILISHRGNINGSIKNKENDPNYLDIAISKGYDIEIDIWIIGDNIWLGHDEPQYSINMQWLVERKNRLWIHCKNIDALIYLKNSGELFNFFWHQEDDVTITSTCVFWTYPGKKLTSNSIAVMPEIKKFKNIEECLGICSDYIEKYKQM